MLDKSTILRYVVGRRSNVMPTAPVKVDAPTRAPVMPSEDPERYYHPERLCPDQRQDGGWRTRPS